MCAIIIYLNVIGACWLETFCHIYNRSKFYVCCERVQALVMFLCIITVIEYALGMPFYWFVLNVLLFCIACVGYNLNCMLTIGTD